MMFMLLGKSIMDLPFEQAYPLGERDLAVAITQNISIKLSNIITDSGTVAYIGVEMENAKYKDKFGTLPFATRMAEFLELIHARFERYFVTGKDTFLFFDEVEQKTLKDEIFCIPGLTCSVDIIKCSRFEPPQMVGIEELAPSELDIVLKFFRRFKIVFITSPDEALKFILHERTRNTSGASFEEFFRRRNKRHRKESEELNKYFTRYPKLKDLHYQYQINYYFKKLKAKYHPDRPNGDEKLFTIIAGDHAEIKTLNWFLEKDKSENVKSDFRGENCDTEKHRKVESLEEDYQTNIPNDEPEKEIKENTDTQNNSTENGGDK